MILPGSGWWNSRILLTDFLQREKWILTSLLFCCSSRGTISWTVLARSRRGFCLSWRKRGPRRRTPAGSPKTGGMVITCLCLGMFDAFVFWGDSAAVSRQYTSPSLLRTVSRGSIAGYEQLCARNRFLWSACVWCVCVHRCVHLIETCLLCFPFREPWNYLRKTLWASLLLNHTQFTQPHLPAGREGSFSIKYWNIVLLDLCWWLLKAFNSNDSRKKH